MKNAFAANDIANVNKPGQFHNGWTLRYTADANLCSAD